MSPLLKNPFVEKALYGIIGITLAGIVALATSYFWVNIEIPNMQDDIKSNKESIDKNTTAINAVVSRADREGTHFDDHIENSDKLLQKITSQLEQINGSQYRIELLANTTATRQEGLIQDIDELKEEVKEMRRRGTTP